MKKSIHNSEHYQWGEACDGWHLVKTDGLGIIQESMPPNTREQRHYHTISQQFFYILKGNAIFYLKGEMVRVTAGEGIHIKPKTVHHIQNNSAESLDFLVISQPTSLGDRFEEPYNKNNEKHLL